MSNISISFQEEIERGVQEALDNLGDMSGLFRGKHVAVKPNDTWGRILGKENVEHIIQAERLQLGTAALKDIDIVGLPLAEAIQIFRKRSTDKRVEASSMRS